MDARVRGWLLIGLAAVAAGFFAGCQAPTRGSLGCYLERNSCDSSELVAYRSTFQRDRADMLSAVRSWSGCLPDAVACRQALNRIEAATTGFGELSLMRRPRCVDEADRHLGAAIGDFRMATSIGFGASDRNQPIRMVDVSEHLLRATKQLDQASAALARAHC
jgi:hypothetical protein